MSRVAVYIVEDDPIIAESIRMELSKDGINVLGSADNAGDAYFEIDSLRPDLVFLDITIEGKMSGIDLGRKIAERLQIPFIYLTSHADKKTLDDALKTEPAGYLLKPFRQKELKIAVDIALMKSEETVEKSTVEHLFVKDKKKWSKLATKSILYAKADDNYTEIWTQDERFLIAQPLKNVEQKLNSDQFKRVQRSYLVNISEIEGIEDDLIMINGQLIPIGKTYKKDLLDSLTFL